MHSDEVTSVCFMPGCDTMFYTAGQDGMLNLIDLNGDIEDDFLEASYQSTQSIV